MEKKESVLKVPILHRTVPYIYVKMNDTDEKYRISANYKYLNEHYNLKIGMIRDFSKINIKENNNQKETPWFVIYNKTIQVRHEQEWQNWEMGSGDNTLIVKRIIIPHDDGMSTIIIFYRRFKEEYNCSLFFSSDKFYSINELLDTGV